MADFVTTDLRGDDYGKHLVLDIDGTLIDDVYQGQVDDLDPPLRDAAVAVGEADAAVPRPHLEPFLHFAFDRFETVSIWSAASSEWVFGVCEEVLEPCLRDGEEFHFVWHGARVTRKVKPSFYSTYAQSYTIKNLGKIWRAGRMKAAGFRRTNTVIVDDTASNIVRNYGNGIIVPTFHAFGEEQDAEGAGDTVLPDLMRYLDDHILPSPNVRSLDKRFWRALARGDASGSVGSGSGFDST